MSPKPIGPPRPPRPGARCGGRRLPPTAGAVALCLAALALGALPASSQLLEGQARGDDGLPVEGALVGLYTRDGDQRTATLTDAEGFYRLEVPEAGEYLIGAERIGYSPFRSPLLAIDESRERYRLELEMLRAPVPIAGITVTAERQEEIERQIRLLIGINPKSLRNPPIPRDSILAHWKRGLSFPEMLRWSHVAGLTVKRRTDEGYCFEMRTLCVPVYLNGMALQSAWHDMLPLELAETVVIVGRNESIAYPGGAILVYTEGWMR